LTKKKQEKQMEKAGTNPSLYITGLPKWYKE